MPFYEYRPKSGVCGICDGCFVDLQKMSDVPHTQCPDCGQECERVIAMPIVSIRGAEYRANSNKEKRTENLARAGAEVAKLREDTLKKFGTMTGHTHNCALAGCYGADVKKSAAAANEDSSASKSEAAHRFGGLPHLVGVETK